MDIYIYTYYIYKEVQNIPATKKNKICVLKKAFCAKSPKEQ